MERTILDLAGVASQVALAALFLVAGLAKAPAVGRLQRTIEQLGLDRARAGPAAVGVVGSELVAAAGLLVSPAASWPRLLAVVLAGGFAVAGLKALSAKEPIGCSCFGNVGQGRLGWRQVALLPGWLVLVALAQARPPGWGPAQGLAGLAALVLAFQWGTYSYLQIGPPEASAGGSGDGGSSLPVLLIGGVVVLAAVGGGLLLARRRSATRDERE